jgi:hypothetical protein
MTSAGKDLLATPTPTHHSPSHPTPPTMSGSNEPTKPELNGMITYVLVTHGHFGSDFMDTVEILGVYLSIEDAVSALKKQRLNLEHFNLEDAWILARDSDARDNSPYRNKIGELISNNGTGGTSYIGWGYAWPHPDGKEGNDFVYLEKTNIWNGSSEIGDRFEMDPDEVRVLEAESDIEYVDGQYLLEHTRFDETSGDVVFGEGEEYDSEQERIS